MMTNCTHCELLEELVDYCQEFGSVHCFRGWARPVLTQYLAYHLNQRTVAYTRKGDRIVGLGVAWQFNAYERLDPYFVQFPFHFQPTLPSGDSLFVADMIATDSRAMSLISVKVIERWPQWESLKCYSIRKGRIVSYNLRRLLQLVIL